MRNRFLGRNAVIVIGALSAFILTTPASSDEAVHLTLIHEQTLESEPGSDEPVSLFNLCGRDGFLFGRQDEGGQDHWYLQRISDGALSDTGMTYPEEWPLGCSADGRWVMSTPFFGSGTASLLSLVEPGTGPFLSIERGMPIWSNFANAALVVFVISGDSESSIVQNRSNEDVEIFAAGVKQDSVAGWPIWTSTGNLLVALSGGGGDQVFEFSGNRFRFDESIPINPLMNVEKGEATDQISSLLHTMKLESAEKINLQSAGGLILVQEFGNPPTAVRHLCTKEAEWQCKPVLATPKDAIAGFFYPQIVLLDAVGRLFWIEDRDGEFCAVLASASSQDATCVADTSLGMFEEIFHYELDPDQRYLFVTGRRPYEHRSSYLAVFELAIVPGE